MEIAILILEYLRVLIWPIVVLFGVLIFKEPIHSLFKKLNKLVLPGGTSIDFGKEIKEAEKLSEEVKNAPVDKSRKQAPTIPITEANARMLSLGLELSPSGLDMNKYMDLAKEDPNIALAGLRMELEILVTNVAKGFKIEIVPYKSTLRVLKSLYDSGAVSSDQYSLLRKIINLCNAAIHGTRVSREEAESVIDLGQVLAQDYLAWLSWGFPDNWKPKEKNDD